MIEIGFIEPQLRLVGSSSGLETQPLLEFLRDQGIEVGFDACAGVLGVSTNGVTITLFRSAFATRVLDNFSNGESVVTAWAGSSHG
jgi:hypothetical protein